MKVANDVEDVLADRRNGAPAPFLQFLGNQWIRTPFEPTHEEAVDVRMFGGTFSFNTDDDIIEAINEYLPQNLTGPVQFNTGSSIHPVVMNEEANSLTSVIGTGDNKQQGGFDLADHRIKYGYIQWTGQVNPNAAADTKLQREDVEEFDTLLWRALSNQTTSRVKMGLEPRLYLRVEFSQPEFKMSTLGEKLSLDDERSKPTEEIRSLDDHSVDVSRLVQQLRAHEDKIETVRVTADELGRYTCDGEAGDHTFLYKRLAEALGNDRVEWFDVYDEIQAAD